jgi:NAD(P)-dependent dehydrogenase (short-subunit alcohol dehydrogenase family)
VLELDESAREDIAGSGALCLAGLYGLHRDDQRSELSMATAFPDFISREPASSPSSGVVAIPGFSLLGKKVFITGGSRGIGRACALTLAAAGAEVAIGASPSGGEVAEQVVHQIDEMGRRAQAYCFDVAVPRDVESMCARINEEFDGIDILVNNAGVTRDRSFRKMERGAWDDVINTNLNSVFEVTKRFIDPMAARGWGRVINISSIVGRIGNFGQANYAAAKAGLLGFTKSLAREYASKGVTVNAIAPGFIRTRMLDGIPDKALKAVLDLTPVGRLGDPMEIGASVLYLASPAAGFVTGHVLDVNGGMAM